MRTCAAFAALSIYILLSLATVTSAQSPPPAKIPVFVTSSGAGDGFTDPDGARQDAVKDLTQAVSGKDKTLTVVAKRDDSLVVLTVLSRQKGGFWGPGNTMRVKLAVKGFETEVVATVRGGAIWQGYSQWGPVAGRVATEVEKWVVANRDRIAAPAEQKPEK
jgi:hypothetical protein